MTRSKSAVTTLTALVLATAGLAASSPATADGGLVTTSGRPDTRIFEGPDKVTDRANSIFRFRTDPRRGSTFRCSIDGGYARSCASPYKVRVRPGTHTIEIRAKRDGLQERQPATYTWTYAPAED